MYILILLNILFHWMVMSFDGELKRCKLKCVRVCVN